MGALTDLKAITVGGADESLGLATGVDIANQVNAAIVKVQETTLLLKDLQSLGVSGGLNTSLGTVITDLS